jgi:hypothetical protein
LELRFWAKVQVVDDAVSCWDWTGSIGKTDGYGRISVGGRRGSVVASRVSYVLNRGPIPDGLLVLHTCIANRRCVRPDHLYLGDGSRNTLDSVEQGRHVSQVAPDRWQGMKNGGAKLTDAQVLDIRSRAASGMRQRALASEYRVCEATVSVIVNRKQWRHLP